MGPRCSCEPPPQRAVTRVLCCVLCSVLGRLPLDPGHPSSPPISPTTVFNAIGNVVVSQCGRGGPSQVSAGAGRAWASHRTLCCTVAIMSMPPLKPPLLYTIPCAAGGARGLTLLQRTGATGIRIFIWPRTRVGTRPEHTPLRPQATTPQASGWCVWLQVQHCNVDDGCPPCVSPGAASPPPLFKFTGPPFWRSPLQLWLPSEVLPTRMAGGPGCTKHPQATTSGGPLSCFPCCGPGL